MAYVAPLLASEHQIVIILEYENRIDPIHTLELHDAELKPHQKVLTDFIDQSPIDIRDWGKAISTVKPKALELVDGHILKKFPDEAYRQNKILEILLNESGDISHDTLLQAKKHIKELIEYVGKELKLFSEPDELFMPNSHEERHQIRTNNIAISSIREIYDDKFESLRLLTSFAGARALGWTRQVYYEKMIRRMKYYVYDESLRERVPTTPAAGFYKKAYYDFLKECGLQNPEALNDNWLEIGE
ncbi:MAG: hypothetical protein ACK4V2_00500 [Pseudomonadota bacterium]|jgi:hypothetical protein|nr:hypothetical protein [Alphaproteobacteria bacterium]